nr:MAG TPA: hypothetical protein [Bacteriophage sp.]
MVPFHQYRYMSYCHCKYLLDILSYLYYHQLLPT